MPDSTVLRFREVGKEILFASRLKHLSGRIILDLIPNGEHLIMVGMIVSPDCNNDRLKSRMQIIVACLLY